MTNYQFKVDKAAGRIDKFLSQQLSEFSRSKIQDFIRENKVKVNGQYIKPNYKLEAGDQVDAQLEEKSFDLLAEAKPLDILYEDEDILLINKESDLVVHPAPGHESGTLVNRLLAHTDQLSDLNGKERPGIVHRLDKDTSGLLIVAKNNLAHHKLGQQFKKRQVLRQYTALVEGQMESVQGMIDLPIGRDPQKRTRYAVSEEGKEAISHFKTVDTFDHFSLLQVQLETGRTHQIRVHLSYLTHPIVGDKVYGSKVKLDEAHHYGLHASKIGFYHPRTKAWMEFEQAVPTYFSNFIRQLK